MLKNLKNWSVITGLSATLFLAACGGSGEMKELPMKELTVGLMEMLIMVNEMNYQLLVLKLEQGYLKQRKCGRRIWIRRLGSTELPQVVRWLLL